jgi:hypothetical protein
MNRSTEIAPTVHADAGFRLCVASEYAQRIEAEGLTSKAALGEAMAKARCVPGGRAPHWILESVDPEERIRVRPSRHGGVLGRALADRSLFPRRIFREFSIWTKLRERGIPLPVPVFAVSQRQGLFWHSAFASIDQQNMSDGLACLEAGPAPHQLDALCISFAKALRAFHDAGAIHGDLQIRNILIEAKDGQIDSEQIRPPACLLIDLDRTRIVGTVSPRQRIREFLRLLRSLEKTGQARLTSRHFCALALSAYCAGDRPLRRSMLRWVGFESFGMRRHRVAWRLARRIRLARDRLAKPSHLTKSLR